MIHVMKAHVKSAQGINVVVREFDQILIVTSVSGQGSKNNSMNNNWILSDRVIYFTQTVRDCVPEYLDIGWSSRWHVIIPHFSHS